MNPLSQRTHLEIARLHDEGKYADEIALAMGCATSTVYAMLRVLRPKRKRRPHRSAPSPRVRAIQVLAAGGIRPNDIARLLKVSRQRVSFVLRYEAKRAQGA